MTFMRSFRTSGAVGVSLARIVCGACAPLLKLGFSCVSAREAAQHIAVGISTRARERSEQHEGREARRISAHGVTPVHGAATGPDGVDINVLPPENEEDSDNLTPARGAVTFPKLPVTT